MRVKKNYNAKLHDKQHSPDIMRVVKPRKFKCKGDVASRGKEKSIQNFDW
jgi:hypothetical protein